ncbi:MAG: penicillin-binding protein activator LpoB [Gemmatimonas sp.]|nr:penicillin-binding protein activator LpoB [Gemmatimonas sp.]
MLRPRLALAGLAATVLALSACSIKRVERIDPNSVTDLSGRWNDADSRLVANALIAQSLEASWSRDYAAANGGTAPAVIVGQVRNRTMEHIPVSTFIRDMERAYVQSGMVRLVAGAEEREELRGERTDQQTNASAETRARLARELGARYMLQGEVQAIEDQEGRERVIFYQVDLTLTDLETNVRTWVGQHKIKKYIQSRRITP